MKPPPFTCGLETSYLWNHQRDHDSASAAPMPECTGGDGEQEFIDEYDGGDYDDGDDGNVDGRRRW